VLETDGIVSTALNYKCTKFVSDRNEVQLLLITHMMLVLESCSLL